VNPLPFVAAIIRKDWWATVAFILFIALAAALGVAMTAQEKALRSGSARAADHFDLVVSAPGSQTDVLFKTVFLRPGTVELLPPEITAKLLTDNRAAFAAPLGFGDSHDGDAIAGTTRDLVTAISGGALAEGRMFQSYDEAVVGANSPLAIGAKFHAEHGHGEEEEEEGGGEHGTALTVVGRMAATGSPWDRAIVVPIEQMWLVHNLPTGHNPLNAKALGPPFDSGFLPGVPAVIVKPKTLSDAYRLRGVYRSERSTAFFPAEVLLELYGLMGDIRQLMSLMALGTQALVIGAIVAGVIALLRVHRKQFATLRALGAPRSYILAAIWLYVAIIVGIGSFLGLALGWVLAKAVSSMVAASTGIALSPVIGWSELTLVTGLIVVGCLLALVPAIRFYREPIINALR
jgi:putative ABC transport system permease protein